MKCYSKWFLTLRLSWVHCLRNGLFNLLLYTDSQKHESTLLHSIRMYWTNFWQMTVHAKQFFFEKTLYEVGSSHLYASFWHLLLSNWSIIRGTVRLWRMLEHRQINGCEGKCRQFRNYSECLKTHCAAKNDQFGRKRC